MLRVYMVLIFSLFSFLIMIIMEMELVQQRKKEEKKGNGQMVGMRKGKGSRLKKKEGCVWNNDIL